MNDFNVRHQPRNNNNIINVIPNLHNRNKALAEVPELTILITVIH